MEKSNSKSVIVRAPGKLMLMGEHAVVYGYPCLVTSVNQYITVKAGVSESAKDSISTGISDDRFVRAALSVLRSKYSMNSQVKISTESEIGKYGLGSSAGVAVAALKALTELFELSINNQNLFSLSYQTVIKIQKKASGFDLAASIYGGTILFDGKTKQVEKLTNDPLPLVVAYSGNKADTVSMIKQVAQLRSRKRIWLDDIFRSITKLVLQASQTLQNKNWRLLGILFNENQNFLSELGVSTPKIDYIIKKSLNSGAYGVKLSGAGGGDCIIALAPTDKRNKIKKAIEQAGGIVLDIVAGAEGVRVI